MRRVELFLFCFFLVGCTPTITKKEYDQKCAQAVNMHNTLTGQVYYQGSKEGYDYFLFEPFAALSHHARVKQGDVVVSCFVDSAQSSHPLAQRVLASVEPAIQSFRRNTK